MSGDKLERLLKQADASAGSPGPLPGDLARRVRRLGRRRRKARIAAASAGAAIAAIAAVSAWQFGGGPGPQRTVVSEPADQVPLKVLNARIADLETQADLRQAAVSGLLAGRRDDARLGELRQQIWLLEATDPLERRFDQAARELLSAADRIEYELSNPRAARELYRQVIRQFPDTSAAQFARARLTEPQSTTGESS